MRSAKGEQYTTSSGTSTLHVREAPFRTATGALYGTLTDPCLIARSVRDAMSQGTRPLSVSRPAAMSRRQRT